MEGDVKIELGVDAEDLLNRAYTKVAQLQRRVDHLEETLLVAVAKLKEHEKNAPDSATGD